MGSRASFILTSINNSHLNTTERTTTTIFTTTTYRKPTISNSPNSFIFYILPTFEILPPFPTRKLLELAPKPYEQHTPFSPACALRASLPTYSIPPTPCATPYIDEKYPHFALAIMHIKPVFKAYNPEELLYLRESPLVAKPPGLPPQEQWMG